MLSEQDIERAHREAFDFAWGNLPRDRHAEFTRHLGGCRYCQGVVGEYSETGRIIKLLPPHVEPSAELGALDHYRGHQLRGHSGPVHDRPDGWTENTPEGTSDGRPEGRLEGTPEGWRGCDDAPELGTGTGPDGAGLLLGAALVL